MTRSKILCTKSHLMGHIIKSMSDQTSQAESQQIITEVLFNSIGDGAITTDEYGKLTRINPVAEKLLGYSSKEVVGIWFPKLFTAYDSNGAQMPITERPLTRALVTGQIISEHVIYKHKNGSLVRLSLTISPININKKLVGCIQILRDISSEYEIDKMKSDFISLASHQLRTPLSAVKTYTHMLIDGMMGPLSQSQLKSLKTILTAVNRMNETVSTLLNISRIESGTIVAERKPLQAQKIINSVIDDHRLTASDKDITFSVNCPSDGFRLVTDGMVLKEVLGNLVSNAIKYTPSKGKITISAKRDKTRMIISVSDTGVGIPIDSHLNVFSKFFRAENVIKNEASGIGLGLYLVKGLMNELGGEVWFESQEGKGTTFYLSFPTKASNTSTLKHISPRKVKNVTAKVRKTVA